MTDLRRHTFEPDGRAIPYATEGEGPAIVLLPGEGLNTVYLATLAHVLTEEDFQVVRIGSRRAAEGVTMHDLAKDVLDVLDELGVDHAWIGGHAFGGAVARTFAHDHHDRVNGVLMLGATASVPASAEAQAALDVVFGDPTDAEALAVIEQLIGTTADAAHAWTIIKASRDAEVAPMQRAALAATPTAEWATISEGVPVLVIQGSDDRVTPPAGGEEVRASAPALVSVTSVDGGGHFFAATHPGETSAIIEDYLDWD